MKRAAIWGAVFAFASAVGAQNIFPPSDGRFDQLPEVIFTVNGEACLREDFIRIWRREFPDRSAATQRDSFDYQYESVRESALNEMLLRQIFAVEKIAPTPEEVNAFRRQAMEFIESEVEDTQTDEEMLLSLGVRMLLKKRYPEIIEVKPDEIERFYRENQLRYLVRPSSSFRLIAFAKTEPEAQERATAIYHKLIEGGNFEDYLRELPLESNDAILASQTAEKLAIGAFSPVISGKDNFFIVKTVERKATYFISLEEATPRIRFFLEMEKNTVLLSELLAAERSKAKIE